VEQLRTTPSNISPFSAGDIVAYLPYGVGNFRGTVLGTETNVYRSGLLDSVYRLSVNLKGGPVMTARDYRKCARSGPSEAAMEDQR